MASAFYYHGLTIEFDPGNQRLTVDGEVVPLSKALKEMTSKPLNKGTQAKLIEHAKRCVKSTWDLIGRDAIRDRHEAELKKGVEHWARWRRAQPTIRPLLYEADLKKAPLEKANLANANLIKAHLNGAHLEGANLHEANLGGADLTRACLQQATCAGLIFTRRFCMARI